MFKNIKAANLGDAKGMAPDIKESETKMFVLTPEALQNVMLNSASFSSIATNAQGVIQIFNVGAERMFGYEAMDVISKITLTDFADPLELSNRAITLSVEHGTQVYAGFEALVFNASRGIEDVYNLTCIRKDGSGLPLIMSVTALRDVHDSLTGYLFIGTDNTAHKQSQEALFKANQFIQSTLDAFSEQVCVLDRTGRILIVNQAWRDAYEQERLLVDHGDYHLGLNYLAICDAAIGPDSGEATSMAEGIRRVINGEIAEFTMEYPCHSPDVQRWFKARVTRLQGSGGNVLVSHQNSTTRKLVERSLVKATEVDLIKSEFLSSTAHELRTPLASVFGYAEMLLTMDFPAEQRNEFIGIIHKQSGRMATILNELLDLARIDARRTKDFKLVDLEARALVNAVIADFHMPIGVTRAAAISPQAPHWVRADRGKLIQAISNVLSNAYKYSPAGGSVSVSLIDEGLGSEAPLVGIRIGDHGIGMTPPQLARVFERFYRADTSGKFLGTGLGMSIVKEIIELHRGRIDITSEFGTGTTVTLWMPAIAVASIPAVKACLGESQIIQNGI